MMKAAIEKLNQPNRSNKANKQSQALKNILEKQELTLKTNEGNQSVSLADIQEDLIRDDTENHSPKNKARVITFNTRGANQTTSNGTTIAQSIEFFYDLIEKELAKAAGHLGIDEKELKAWVDLQIEVPAKTILTLLRMMQSLHLDPLSEEIGFTQYDDGHWQVFITIEGCSKLLNQHPQFNGLVFNQADTLVEGVPEWVECSIYRRDRIMPITVREYLMEVRSEKEIWQKMPRRMLRHRALQQCVRLAMG
jgi:hypothetical protein